MQERYIKRIKRAYKYVGREGSVVGRMKTVELNNGGGSSKSTCSSTIFLDQLLFMGRLVDATLNRPFTPRSFAACGMAAKTQLGSDACLGK